MNRSLTYRLSNLAKVACTVLVLGYSTTAMAVPYDDFDNSNFLNSALWTGQTNFSHFIESGRLVLQQVRADRSGSNNIRFVQNSPITAIQATVNVQENTVTDGHGRARMFSTLCDLDNTANGFTNEIFAEINLGRRNGGPLVPNLIISQCTNEDCTTFTDFLFDINNPTFGPASFNTDHVLSVAFDGVDTITFGFDGNMASFGPAQFPALAGCGPSNLDFEAIGSRIGEVDGSTSQGGNLLASFDDVMVNGVLFDNFDQAPAFLDPNNWREQDLERAIIVVEDMPDNNVVRLAQRRGEAPDRSNNLGFSNANTISSIRTDIQIESTDIQGSGRVAARVIGYFFNDGASTDPNDQTGEIFAQLSLIRDSNNDPQNRVLCDIRRVDDPNFDTSTTVFFEDLGVWQVGMIHSVLLEFDPNTNTFVCEFDGQRVTYTLQMSDPQPVGLSTQNFKALNTRISGLEDDGEVGFISAVFDNVEVTFNIDTVGLYDPVSSQFSLRYENRAGSADAVFPYGPPNAGWLPVVGDWDGDGDDTVAVYDPVNARVHLRNSNDAGTADLIFPYGPPNAGWLPVSGDWDGDGADTVGLFDPVRARFHLRNSNTAGSADLIFEYGLPNAGWQPIAGDWDGDGNDTIGLRSPELSRFHLRNSNTEGFADITFDFGTPGAAFVPLGGFWER